MTDVKTCDRCDSKIVTESFSSRPDVLTVGREMGGGTYTTQEAELCSLCWDELWDWTFGDDSPDRSNRADPMALERMAGSVESHIDALEDILNDVRSEVDDD